jgi:hypothetical protein
VEAVVAAAASDSNSGEVRAPQDSSSSSSSIPRTHCILCNCTHSAVLRTLTADLARQLQSFLFSEVVYT